MKSSMNVIVFAALFGLAYADHWSVTEGLETCIVLEANITGVLKYNKVDNTTADYTFNVTSLDSEGLCHEVVKNESAQHIKIKFFPNNMKPPVSEAQHPWVLTLWFTPGKEQAFVLKDFKLHAYFYNSTIFNATEQEMKYEKSDHAETEVGAEDKNAFKCSDTGLSFTEGTTMNMKALKVIAFALLNSTDFPAEQTFAQCSLDARTSDIVPIVVGACLAILVIVVLIAYLIGRARAKRQGYASV